ncbi:hypothetical protein DRO66_01460 [Candidatus Bathyarchaeota archaeon]|jgi:hypothetical protein|nr:hypothetical protein [Candidatus Bathyarchaeota archaeon]RLI38488.1 MAG: hypothetical protein DRO66_01460 [Candidatus Bathyarchaeota archaeon]
MSEDEVVEVVVTYRGLEVKFSGDINEVVRFFLEFLNKMLPTYELVSRLTLTIDLEKLVTGVEGIIAITPEGLIVIISQELLGEREVILLHLVKTYIGYQLGKLDLDIMSISDIISITSGKPSSSAARLSELVQMNWVERAGRGEYRITTYGIKSFSEEILPKIKAVM